MRRRNLFVLLNARLCLTLKIIAALAVLAPTALGDTLKGWATDGLTSTIALIDVQESPAATLFILKNLSTRPATAFTVSHDTISHTIDYFQTDADLAPGATYTLQLASREIANAPRVLRMTAIIFADGSTLGLDGDLAFIHAKRLGRVVETERIKRILDLPVDTKAREGALRQIRTKIGDLPQSTSELLSAIQGMNLPGMESQALAITDKKNAHGFLFGVRNARQDVLWKLDQFERLVASSGEQAMSIQTKVLSGLRQLYGVLSEKNRDFIELSQGGTRR
jgi:hypothetical protein